MRKTLLQTSLLIVLTLFVLPSFGQAPQSFSYQAVARDVDGNLLANQAIALRFTIHDLTANGTTLYQETQNATSTALGLVNVTIGTGTVVNGVFAAIPWGTGAKFLEVEIDATGGTNYIALGTTQMLSVPYALYAEKAGNSAGGSKMQMIQVDGTSSLSVGSSMTSFTLIPGLSYTFTLTDTSKVKITTTGGLDMETQDANEYSYVDVSFFVDGQMDFPPGHKRLWAINTSVQSPWTYYSFSNLKTLSPGQHTIEVKVKYGESSTGNINIGGNEFEYRRASLQLDIIPE